MRPFTFVVVMQHQLGVTSCFYRMNPSFCENEKEKKTVFSNLEEQEVYFFLLTNNTA